MNEQEYPVNVTRQEATAIAAVLLNVLVTRAESLSHMAFISTLGLALKFLPYATDEFKEGYADMIPEILVALEMTRKEPEQC